MLLRRSSLCSLLLATALAACGPSGGDDDPAGGPDAGIAQDDTDGDGIGDAHEGRAEGLDTDADGTPDWQDDDSDGDGIDDALEAGDGSATTPPRDSDDDGAPDFQDLDADGNGIADRDESTGDALDGDGDGDWRDLDDDGDGIGDVIELGDGPGPLDSDGDQIPDYHDLDSDGDAIADRDERNADADLDDVPNFRDDDSDGDCVLDLDEAGDGLPDTPPRDTDDDGAPDFVDVDSDADGLGDAAEDADCDGTHDAGESSATAGDTDGDGATDLVEDAAGTSPTDPSDSPQANGDFVFVVPYQAPPSPADDDLDFSTSLQQVDVYVMMDLSGSMADELADIHANMDTVLDNLTCPPAGSGDPATCIPDLFSGLGTFTYAERNAYANRIRMQANPGAIGAATLASDGASCTACDEPHWLALWLAATGNGTATSGCTLASTIAPSPGCATSAAGAGGIGYPCFRPGALPVVLMATDEAPSLSFTCPAEDTAIAALAAIGARLIGIAGSGVDPGETPWVDLETLAAGTGAVDAANGNAPLVFAGAGAGAADAIQAAIETLAAGVPLDMAAVATDDGGDGVDAVAAFVDHLETLQLGTAACAAGLTDQDSDADGFDDRFVDVRAGTPVCWKLVARENTTVPPASTPQLFRATVTVTGDGVTTLDTRDVYFLVPPDLDGPGVE